MTPVKVDSVRIDLRPFLGACCETLDRLIGHNLAFAIGFCLVAVSSLLVLSLLRLE